MPNGCAHRRHGSDGKGCKYVNRAFVDYIENSLRDIPYDDILYNFEKKTAEEAEKTERRVRKAGLNDEKIINDLLVSEHADIREKYGEYRRAELKRRREHRMHVLFAKGTPIYFLAAVAVYLLISFATHAWNRTWLAIIVAVTVWYDTVGGWFVYELATKRRAFHIISRVILALGVMLTSVCVYLHFQMLAPFINCWVIVTGGVILMYCADVIFAAVTKQRMLIINILVYILASSPMLYVILCGVRVLQWRTGWLLIIGAIFLDILTVAGVLANRRKYVYKPEAAK